MGRMIFLNIHLLKTCYTDEVCQFKTHFFVTEICLEINYLSSTTIYWVIKL